MRCRIYTADMSLNYCPDVWKNLYVSKIDHEQVRLGFCCQNQTTPADKNNWKEIIHKKRQDFSADSWPDQCGNCWRAEKAGASSKRHQEINWYTQQGILQDTSAELIALEWNSENLCNLACITCGPIFSSRWNSEIGKYPWVEIERYHPANQNQFLLNLDLSDVRRVYFNGGEPLMSHDHTQIMQALQDVGVLNQCEIAYNTNGTVMPDQNCLDLWKEARLIRIFVSIDAIEGAFEFIRWPAKWTAILNFLSFLKSQSFNIIIDITCTLGIHNIFSLHKLHAWYTEHCSRNHQGDPVSLNLQPCGPISHGGKVLALDNISPRLSKLVTQYLSELDIDINLQLFHSICADACGNDQNWIAYLDQLSAARKMDWKKQLPELVTQYNIIENFQT